MKINVNSKSRRVKRIMKALTKMRAVVEYAVRKNKQYIIIPCELVLVLKISG